jgi:hypothetical protein
MHRRVAAAFVFVCLAIAGSAQQGQPPQQTWSGVISDSKCGASHQTTAAAGGMTERECAIDCVTGLAKYVVVDDQKNVIAIANQDFAGLPLRLARPVRVTGVLTENGILVSRIEPPLVHAHIGHVMIAWRDTPGTVGLLTVALSDARVADAHALLTSKATTNLDDMKLHAAHVLHALDPAVEPKGPASGYGTKRAAAGALQHVGFAAAVEGASPAVKTQAAAASARLTETLGVIDRTISTAQKIRAATTVAEAAALAGELAPLTAQIGAGLHQAELEMRAMMKAEGL